MQHLRTSSSDQRLDTLAKTSMCVPSVTYSLAGVSLRLMGTHCFDVGLSTCIHCGINYCREEYKSFRSHMYCKHREELVPCPTRAKSHISDGRTQEDREIDFFLVSTRGNTSRDPLHQALPILRTKYTCPHSRLRLGVLVMRLARKEYVHWHRVTSYSGLLVARIFPFTDMTQSKCNTIGLLCVHVIRYIRW